MGLYGKLQSYSPYPNEVRQGVARPFGRDGGYNTFRKRLAFGLIPHRAYVSSLMPRSTFSASNLGEGTYFLFSKKVGKDEPKD